MYQIVNGIYHTVVSRDILKRHRINKQDLFVRVVKYIIENVGKTFSANSISTFLKSEHRKVSVESIYNYLRWLEQAFIIYPCERYDLQGKSILKTQEKYYLADVSVNCHTFASPWGNEDTQTLIDILARYGVKTTFFVVGDWAEKYPESVKALHDAGHEVMSHSNHHDHYNSLSTQQIIDDVTASNERISAVTGVTPTLIRCPYGEYDDHVIAAIRSMGMEPIQWDVDSLDWKDYDADTICRRVTSKVQPGSIVLFHNAALHTPEALPAILDCLINDGYTVVPISQLILDPPYTIDHTGRQFPAETVSTT